MSSSDVLGSIVLGVVQGITEWLPISSEGSVAAVANLAFGHSLADSLAQAIWLHIGTALAAMVALRKDVLNLSRECLSKEKHGVPVLLSYLVVASAVGAIIAVPILLFLEDISSAAGGFGMGAVGVLLLITALAQRRRPALEGRGRETVKFGDGFVTGIAQGFAALPGLSRSGLTVAALLARRIDRREALALSFLASIPVTLGASLLVGARHGMLASPEALIAAGVAFLVGWVTIRALLGFAARVDFSRFTMLLAVAFIAGGLVQVFVL